ncbi:MAG: copper oxidase [Candidatus Binatia bacterium]
MALLLYVLALVFLFPCRVLAQAPVEDPHAHHMHHDHEHHGMRMDMDGSVMNENVDQLPRDCPKITGERELFVRAGKKYAQQLRGTMFSYDQREWNVDPCTKVTVTLVNEDNARHQWMVHGLPRYLYPEGMFHLEVNGGAQKTGTFIVPSARKTYLVHCDVAQHMEKGMKAQLKVGGGDGDLSSIPGVTRSRQSDKYPVQWNGGAAALLLVAGLCGVGVIMFALR